MPLSSVQQYTKSIIDGLWVPGTSRTIEAYITPPTVDDLDGPKAFVLGGRLRTSRQTMPRRAGFKHLAWVVDVYLSYETNPDSPTVDVEFPQIVDTVMAAFWSATIPTFIDANGRPITEGPDGGPVLVGPPGSSQILNTGEDFELEYPPERVPATLRMLYYTARLGIDIYEAVQA